MTDWTQPLATCEARIGMRESESAETREPDQATTTRDVAQVGTPDALALLGASGRGMAASRAQALRSLQHTHGNRAVARALARQVTPAAPDTPATEYESAVAAHRWEQAAMLLSGFGEEGINQRVQALGSDALLQIMVASSTITSSNIGRIRQPVMRRLDELHEAEIEARFNAAIAVPNYEEAAGHLMTMNHARWLPVLRAIPAASLDPLAAAVQTSMPGWSDDLYRTVRFVAHAPAAHTTDSQFTFVTQGTVENEADVGGGHVRVQTEPTIQAIGHGNRRIAHGYTMAYTGPDAPRTRWLQFIWREIEVTHPTRGTYKVRGTITTSGGSYDLTTDPTLPNYNTDAAPGAPTPFYEESGGHNRTADATTMWDHPSSMDDLVQTEFRNGATQVSSRAHFNTWLVRDMDVLYRVQLNVAWNYTNRREPPRTQNVAAAGPASALDARMRERFLVQFPNFDYLP
jgi:hypothetical protein